MAKVGRPSLFTPALGDAICERIAIGQPLAQIALDPKMPEAGTVIRWQRENAEFNLAYARARMEQADYFADKIIEIALEMVKIADAAAGPKGWMEDPETGKMVPDYDTAAVLRSRIEARTKMIDHLKWTAAKLKPQSYGERLEAHLSGQIETKNLNVNVDVNSLTPDAREALRLALAPRVSALAGPKAIETESED